MIDIICENCGNTFSVIDSRKNARFCCKKCEAEYRSKISKEIRICKFCGKEFIVNKSEKKVYCSAKCMGLDKQNQVEKTCNFCGNRYKVIKIRQNTSLYCCRECADKARKAEPNTICIQCGKPFYRKPSQKAKAKHGCFCSYECLNIWKQTAYKGEGNHQFGLKGDLNSSYKGEEIQCKNVNQTDDLIYCPSHPRATKAGRVRKYIIIVEENYELFDEKYFYFDGEKHYLKKGVVVHHIDQNHNNNNIDNLIPLTISEHTKMHQELGTYNYLGRDKLGRYYNKTAVLKQGELLENPEVDNQQPSTSLTTCEGSETNG